MSNHLQKKVLVFEMLQWKSFSNFSRIDTYIPSKFTGPCIDVCKKKINRTLQEITHQTIVERPIKCLKILGTAQDIWREKPLSNYPRNATVSQKEPQRSTLEISE